jgi:hypothetical protein
MPFGLINAPATFQRLMNHILRSVIRKFALVYLDDVIIYSTSIEQHIEHIDIVLGLLQNMFKNKIIEMYVLVNFS